MTGIVVGVDGSDGAARALRWAVRESTVRQGSVRAIMAWGTPVEDSFDPSASEAEARAALGVFVTAAVGRAAATSIDTTVVQEAAGPALVAAADEADLLVIGARGLGGFRGLPLGSVSQFCLRHASCPIAVVKEHAPREGGGLERILVGVDSSEGSHLALNWALNEAKVRGAALEAIHAWHIPLGSDGSMVRAGTDLTSLADAAEVVLDQALDELDTRGLVQPIERQVLPDGAAGAIVGSARTADLLVVGSRDSNGAHAVVLGSVSYEVVRQAPCSVIVVPGPECSE